jgi:hypothetical protein
MNRFRIYPGPPRRLLAALLLPPLVGLAACTGDRTAGSLERGFLAETFTVDNGTGAAPTIVATTRRMIDPQTGERTGPFVEQYHVLSGPSNGAVVISALAGVAGAAIQATGAVMAADRLGCGRNCGSGTQVYVEGAFASANSSSYSAAGARAGADISVPVSRGHFPHGGN